MNTKDILLESLERFCTNTSGECKNSFFENWFTNNGKTYNFMTTHEFIDFTSNIIESFIDEKVLKDLRSKKISSSEIQNNLQIICSNYENLFSIKIHPYENIGIP